MGDNRKQVSHDQQACLILSRLTNESIRPCGSGSMSPSIYDTAWVSMVSRKTTYGTFWVFPESFQYVLNTQRPDGCWPSYNSQVDGILNTSASLLALIKHNSTEYENYRTTLPEDLSLRIKLAQTSLEEQLLKWDVAACDHVGFEYLVPALLAMLRDHKLEFDFPGRHRLMQLNNKKLNKFKPEWIYHFGSTAIHSLEAFVGKIDFDKVVHQKTNGSFMASPASTAAYLMNSSAWDPECELYLRDVINEGSGKGDGSVPCAFPTTFFELTWVVPALLKAGFSTQCLGQYNLNLLQGVLEKGLAPDNVIGFAPLVFADADDTAKAILTNTLLGKPVSPDQMIRMFGLDTHFQTYAHERTPSFTTTCNVLNAFLHLPNTLQYIDQVEIATTFLCKSWAAGKADDKWNLSIHYPMMLLAQAFRKMLILWDGSQLPGLKDELLQNEIPLALLQMLHRTLHWQNLDGSWGTENKCETTAYALLTLVDLFDFPWFDRLASKIIESLEAGRKFLEESRYRWGDSNYLWIEKVTYSSSVLSSTYCLAASHAITGLLNSPSHEWKLATKNLIDIPENKVKKLCAFFAGIPLFREQPDWKLQASLIEAYIFMPRLHRARLEVFPRLDMAKDTYLEYIPFTWTGCNNMGAFLEPDLLWDMMIISMLNYQADEFMESVIGSHFSGGFGRAEDMVKSLFGGPIKYESRNIASRPNSAQEGRILPSPPQSDASFGDIEFIYDSDIVSKPLKKFVNFVLYHPGISAANQSMQNYLSRHLEMFLLAHLKQCADNASFLIQKERFTHGTFDTSISHWEWIHTISATHTSCPYSWQWIQCRIATKENEPFPTATARYLSCELAAHLAAMCRMYNDYGSLGRDKEERNLNSVDFREFGTRDSEEEENNNLETKKEELFNIAEYERANVVDLQARLAPLIDGRTRRALKLFVDVTDLYGQIYVARDIASRMK